MLTNRLFSVLLFTTFLRHGRCSCHTVPTDLNTKWREADVLTKYFDIYLQHLPKTVEDECDSQKRFIAVYSQTIMEYVRNNITDHDKSVRDAAHRTRKMLDKPSSVLAATIRALSSWVLSLIDQPLADVLRACPYSARESRCSLALSDLQTQRMKTCPNYSTNVAMYDRYKQFANSCGVKQLFDDLLQHSANGDDSDAIDFFMEAAAVKHKSVITEFKSFALMDVSQCTCTTLSFL